MENLSEETMVLAQLKQGMQAIILSQETGDLQLNLMEMGCIPGEPVCIEMVAPMGDPLAIRIAGYYLSIRKADAQKILVRLVG